MLGRTGKYLLGAEGAGGVPDEEVRVGGGGGLLGGGPPPDGGGVVPAAVSAGGGVPAETALQFLTNEPAPLAQPLTLGQGHAGSRKWQSQPACIPADKGRVNTHTKAPLPPCHRSSANSMGWMGRCRATGTASWGESGKQGAQPAVGAGGGGPLPLPAGGGETPADPGAGGGGPPDAAPGAGGGPPPTAGGGGDPPESGGGDVPGPDVGGVPANSSNCRLYDKLPCVLEGYSPAHDWAGLKSGL